MRILGFTRPWDKLKEPDFTTFRFTRRDRDWEAGEYVQIYLYPRTKRSLYLGMASIITKDLRHMWKWSRDEEGNGLSRIEAIKDGFRDRADMVRWLGKAHGSRIYDEPMNKLTLHWFTDPPKELPK